MVGKYFKTNGRNFMDWTKYLIKTQQNKINLIKFIHYSNS